MDWLRVHRGDAPLVIAFPHGGTDLAGLDEQFVSPWQARIDTDWWIADLYAFAADLGATLVATGISRSVIDMNRDPSGASLYPGQATTDLCPTTTFDGDPLYRVNGPDQAEIERRLGLFHRPYHEALAGELRRLKAAHGTVVLYDAHSIRSRVPRLFDGELPQFNIGTNGGATCAPELEAAVDVICAASGHGHVVNGRFKGGWTTRHYGDPGRGIHAIQMELAQRGYMAEPVPRTPANWPSPLDSDPAVLASLRQVIAAARDFAKGKS
ncbi:N-formylglutamate deformylase [Rhizorhabdus dicambivorans]|uniref:N-formylglutamate deformylase n=1 Tax=Rhizorhabdus dicambivorans TaxID=1850238 RepID=A0A2A4FT80_9SPHN|nr:N-formylglutamate deformylase [Rhizorhabdus dicambivorans]ATE65435.1 N-formylglutamate deformylase [Rhizorhabdus dicambivorans]PCE40601.1 N-formylglutamate deformylase [Rhizorhabdus dicambivorans]